MLRVTNVHEFIALISSRCLLTTLIIYSYVWRAIVTNEGVWLMKLLDLVDPDKISNHSIVRFFPSGKHFLDCLDREIILCFLNSPSLLVSEPNRALTELPWWVLSHTGNFRSKYGTFLTLTLVFQLNLLSYYLFNWCLSGSMARFGTRPFLLFLFLLIFFILVVLIHRVDPQCRTCFL